MDRQKLQETIAANRHFTESRKVSLYSNFSRLEESNPDGYEANITAWREVLEDAVQNQSFADATCIDAGPELVANLSDVRNGVPLSLSSVIDRMVNDGSLVPLQRFRSQYPSTPAQGLLSNTTRALGWIFNGIVQRGKWSSKDSSSDGSGLMREKYVDIKAVANGADMVVKKLASYAENNGNNLLSKTFTQEQVKELIGDKHSALDVELYLSYASHNKMLNYNKSLDVAKLASAGPITEMDHTITSLRKQINELHKREESLSNEIRQCDLKAREVIKTNRKMAKSLLQKKAGLEKSFDRTTGTLDQLETIMHKIDDANDNKQSYEALQSSSAVLNELNKSLSIDDVEDLVSRLQEATADADEVTSSLADLNINRDLEEIELDDELKQLEEEESLKKIENDLPSVPVHKPQQPAGKERQKTPPETQRQRERELERKKALAS